MRQVRSQERAEDLHRRLVQNGHTADGDHQDDGHEYAGILYGGVEHATRVVQQRERPRVLVPELDAPDGLQKRSK